MSVRRIYSLQHIPLPNIFSTEGISGEGIFLWVSCWGVIGQFQGVVMHGSSEGREPFRDGLFQKA
jgi:hypothetical protein